jgi:hypothetical protein
MKNLYMKKPFYIFNFWEKIVNKIYPVSGHVATGWASNSAVTFNKRPKRSVLLEKLFLHVFIKKVETKKLCC